MLAAGLSFGINKSVFTTCITTALSFSIKRTCTRLEFLKPKSAHFGVRYRRDGDSDKHVAPQRCLRQLNQQLPSVLCNDTKAPLHDSVACSVSARS